MAKWHYRYYDSYYFKPTRPLKAKEGIKARSRKGEFVKSWWASRWIRAMEFLMDAKRLQRGRRYARMGQVLSIKEIEGGVKARVQGSRHIPYEVTIRVNPLSDAQWEKVIDALADQAIFTAQLLAGEMPPDIEEVFSAAGVSLFPDKRGELITDCSCPDWANPCKHVAATHYILGERFDEDPFLLFRLRGRTQEQILEALRQRRVSQEAFEGETEEEQEETIPLEEMLPRFWEMDDSLEHFPLAIKPPLVAMPLLKRLGEPEFMVDVPLQSRLGPAYQAITKAALATAFSEGGEQ